MKALRGTKMKIQFLHKGCEISVSCLVVPKISDELPSERLDIRKLGISSQVQLADSGFATPSCIDL